MIFVRIERQGDEYRVGVGSAVRFEELKGVKTIYIDGEDASGETWTLAFLLASEIYQDGDTVFIRTITDLIAELKHH